MMITTTTTTTTTAAAAATATTIIIIIIIIITLHFGLADFPWFFSSVKKFGWMFGRIPWDFGQAEMQWKFSQAEFPRELRPVLLAMAEFIR
jgi:flagellar basal body-associated protein FliL